MEAFNGREFTVTAAIGGQDQEVFVLTSETEDGQVFYNCRISNNEITQIKKEDGAWIQIWGSVPDEDVFSIGSAIEGALLED